MYEVLRMYGLGMRASYLLYDLYVPFIHQIITIIFYNAWKLKYYIQVLINLQHSKHFGKPTPVSESYYLIEVVENYHITVLRG